MAGKATSVYLVVVYIGQLKAVFRKTFFTAKDFNAYVKTDEFKEMYPTDKFQIIKEVY